MKTQVNLDFLMKFFISVVAVILIILSLYYFGSDFANYLGASFTLKQVGVTGGNLGKVKFNITKTTNTELTLSDCLSDCSKYFSTVKDCKGFCQLVCNGGNCELYNVSYYLFVPSTGKVQFPLDIQNYATETQALNGPFKLLPGKNYINALYLLPKNGNSKTNNAFVSYFTSLVTIKRSFKIYPTCYSIGSQCNSDSDCCSYTHVVNSASVNLDNSHLGGYINTCYKHKLKSIEIFGLFISSASESKKVTLKCVGLGGNTLKSTTLLFKNDTEYHSTITCNQYVGNILFIVGNGPKFTLSITAYKDYGVIQGVSCSNTKKVCQMNTNWCS